MKIRYICTCMCSTIGNTQWEGPITTNCGCAVYEGSAMVVLYEVLCQSVSVVGTSYVSGTSTCMCSSELTLPGFEHGIHVK